MSKPLVSASIAAPGFLGLNTQESSITLEDGYALEATNCIIDKYGRLGSRKGWELQSLGIGNFNNQGVAAHDIASAVNYISWLPIFPVGPYGTMNPALYQIKFKDFHGVEIGETIEISAMPGIALPIEGPASPGQMATYGPWTTLPAGETTYTFIAITEDILQAVDTVSWLYNVNIRNYLSATPNAKILVPVPPVPYLRGSHRHVYTSGTEHIITWGVQNSSARQEYDFGFYRFTPGGNGLFTPVITATGNPITEKDFTAATLNNKAFFFQENYRPMEYLSNGQMIDVESNFASYTDPATSSAFADAAAYRAHIPQAGVSLSAYGRIWCARTASDKTTLYFSDLLDGSNWVGGSAGSLDTETILVNGGDEITGLGAQNGQLIVFFKNSIIVLADNAGSSSFDPAQLRLVEVINRVGCVAKDSIQNTGSDIIFLSEDGLRSLGRVIQEKSLPMRDLSANVRDDLVQDVRGQPLNDIKSVYSEDNAFYLLLLPSYDKVYCFDTRQTLQNGALRTTIWDNQTQGSMLATPNEVYFTGTYGFAKYTGYTDNNENYYLKYYTNYFDLGNPNQIKSVKKLGATVIGGSGQDFILKVGFDYEDAYRSFPSQLTTVSLAEYGTAEYGLANTVVASSQSSSTISINSSTHYTVDFSTTPTITYSVPLSVWLDSDTYYYTNDDGTRTNTTIYTNPSHYATEYTLGTVSSGPVKLSVGGSGSVLQIGFETDISGNEISIQKIDVYAKQGRIV